ncbi:MAG: NAD(P)-dependent oxidoreductase [Catalinimonas sp.]
MSKITIGVRSEGKVPVDRRVPLLPAQCVELMRTYPGAEVVVQTSRVRCFEDAAYRDAGIPVVESLEACDFIFGVKEVRVSRLLPGKTYFFFSHTTKAQPYNRDLLRAVLDKGVTLVDYEHLTDPEGRRIIAFGRYAGIVGAYNALLTWGRRTGRYALKPAHQCFDRREMDEELQKVDLAPIKIVVTGTGRVGKGVAEVLDGIHLRRVSAEELRTRTYDEPVYALLSSRDYHERRDGKEWNDVYFYHHPGAVRSTFGRFLPVADLFIAAAFWDPQAPALFTKEDVGRADFRLRVIADITCDIEGSVPTTRRATTISEPHYDYDRTTGQLRAPFSDDDHVTVMAVDNLPSELPRDASRDFGRQLLDNVLPALFGGDPEGIIARATVTRDGALTPPYAGLNDFVRGG